MTEVKKKRVNGLGAVTVDRFEHELVDDMLNEGNVDAVRAAMMVDEEVMGELDAFHPANDVYFTQMKKLVTEVDRRKSRLNKRNRHTLEYMVNGRSLEDIRAVEGITINAKDLSDPLVKSTASLLSSIYLLRIGVNKTQRANMLWRIAVRNEEKRPDLTISAVATINKMMGDNTVATTIAVGQGKDGLTVVVQNQALGESSLDA